MAGKTHLLALDQGTSSSRSIVFSGDGSIVAMAQREFRQIFPKPGWVEHDPREIWESQLATAREALAYVAFALLFVWVSCLALLDRALGRPVAWRGRSIRAEELH